MTTTKRRTVSAACGLLCGAGLILAMLVPLGAASHDVTSDDAGKVDSPEHIAPWINDDGSVNKSKMPEIVPVYGPDGKVVTRDGVEMGVRVEDLAPSDPTKDVARGENPSKGSDGQGTTPAAESLMDHLVPLP